LRTELTMLSVVYSHNQGINSLSIIWRDCCSSVKINSTTYPGILPESKVNAILCARHESLWKSGDTVAIILNLDTIWRRAISLKHRPLYPRGNYLLFQINRNLGGRFGEKQISCPCRELNNDLLIAQPLNLKYTPTTIPRLNILLFCSRFPTTGAFDKCAKNRALYKEPNV
jgi:hypothetical protein